MAELEQLVGLSIFCQTLRLSCLSIKSEALNFRVVLHLLYVRPFPLPHFAEHQQKKKEQVFSVGCGTKQS